MNDTSRTLEQIVTTNPRAAEIFVRHGLDFCCRGKRSLREACDQAHLDVRQVETELARTPANAPDEENWTRRPLAELIDEILEHYHEPLRRDLPRLAALAATVEDVHADKPTRPVGLAAHLAAIQAAVESHLAKEEQILFPLIRSGRGDLAHMPVAVMMQEHEDHGENLRRTRALTCDLTAPPDACASWRELYRGLAHLEAELWKHIHLENYVLFPRALEGSGVGATQL